MKPTLPLLTALLLASLAALHAAEAPQRPVATNGSRELVVEKKLLHFPVTTGATKRLVSVSVDGEQVRRFDIELADGEAGWWAPLDVSAWAGKKMRVVANGLPPGSKALDSLRPSDTLLDSENLYREPLRPQLHFTAKRGWINDPNGLAFYNGEYHLFYQHNPYGWTPLFNWSWGHATSRDLIHWEEQNEALYPDKMGHMYSGSAVVDWNNTSGFGKDGKPPLVLLYTAVGNPTTQCLAYSTDGRTFTKFEGNPVVKQIADRNRDPKVIWHKPTRKWVMVLWVGEPGRHNRIHFLSSPNLREWTVMSQVGGFFECPDFFELPVDGDPAKSKWVLTGASSQYMLGRFDGTAFTPETPILQGHRGKGFYAAQTYSDEPLNRRIQVGWGQAPSPGMSFNQCHSLPLELTLRSTPQGVRLHRMPIKELESLRDGPNQADTLESFRSELVELRAEFEPGVTETVEFNLRGARIAYDAKTQELVVNQQRAPAPLVDGKQRLVVFIDRTMLEVFASDGLTYVPMPFIPEAEHQSVRVDVKGGTAKMSSLQVYKLKSIWQPGTK